MSSGDTCWLNHEALVRNSKTISAKITANINEYIRARRAFHPRSLSKRYDLRKGAASNRVLFLAIDDLLRVFPRASPKDAPS